MKNILVPYDFSECAKHALDYAAFVARKAKAEITLLHVLPRQGGNEVPVGNWTDADGLPDGEVPQMMQLLKLTRKKLLHVIKTPEYADITIRDFVEMGAISKTINAAAKKHKADIIIMGTHGSSGLKKVLAGSNAEQVIRDADIPVISINDGNKKPSIDKIMFATDFSSEADIVFPALEKFAGLFGAKIHLVKIITEKDFETPEHSKKMCELFKNQHQLNGSQVSILHHLRTKEEGIRRFAQLTDMDLIAIGTHGRHGLARFFKGSVAEDVVSNSSLPVLAFNMHKQLDELNKPFHEKEEVNKKQKLSIEPFLTGRAPIV